MVRLREIPRTATFAWSTGAVSPQLVTGTKAGAVDADFSNETVLELWDLDLGNTSSPNDLQPAGTLNVDSRFHAIAWSQPTQTYQSGIIAGALESGSLDLWDAAKLSSSPDQSSISKCTKHTGAIKAVQFNPHRDDLLASAGAKGELYITNLATPGDPFRLGTSAARADDFDALDWNKKVAHILVTGSSGGFATVWDVRAKKESINLNNNGRKAVSSIAWDPTTPTKLATATSSDQDPVVLMWDLRNSNAPEKVLKLHDQGILSLSWSRADPRLLLSCGKDNRTVCWNTETGEAFGEFPIVTNWTFETSWNPRHPGLLATASFDGKIAIQTIQNTNPDTSASTAGQALDGADFFASAQSRPQGATFSLPIAPTWMQRPVSATFGFGGKLVKVGPTEAGAQTSKIEISTFVADPTIGESAEKFEDVLQKGDLKSFCDDKISESKSEEEKADWTVIETLISGSRNNLKQYLGFAEEPAQANGALAKDEKDDLGAKPTAGDDSSFFDNAEGDDNFLSTLAASKGAKTNNPFSVYTGSESDSDKKITRALILGKFEDALDVCLAEKRMSDAFMIAVCGGDKCIDKAKDAYFKQVSGGPNYLRLLASFSGKNLWDIVYNADLKEWKDVMAAICTYASEEDFPDLCEALGDRLEESISGSRDTARKDASFCYLSGSKLEKVVAIWLQELQEMENSTIKESNEESSFFSIHARSLQDFIEKVTVFRQVTEFQDEEHSKPDSWKLAPLYAKYSEYADILASQGNLKGAERYLDLLPADYPAAEVARNRVKRATQKGAATATAATQRTAAPATSQRGQRVIPSFQPAAAPSIPTPTAATSMYAPPGAAAVPAATPFAAPLPPQNAYTPSGYQPPNTGYPSQPYGGPSYGGYGAPAPPPPRMSSQSPAVEAPSKTAANMAMWNDTPDFGPKPAAPRRATPTVYGQPAAVASPPQATGYGAPPKSSTPVPPPPRAGSAQAMRHPVAPPPVSSHEPRPPSSAANVYAPPVASTPSAAPQQMIPRGASPYNPPPASGPSASRYAPVPGSTPTPSTPYGAAPPQARPPPSQFAPPRASSYGAPPMAAGGPPPASSGPPPPPPKGGATRIQPPPPAGSSKVVNTLPSPQPSDSRPGSSSGSKPLPQAPQYPAGDRSHIPAASVPIFEVLSAEMARVKSKAPAAYTAQVNDTEKRLNILFDNLNNQNVLKPDTIEQMRNLASAVKNRQHDSATGILTEIMTGKTDEGSNWMVGVKRLIIMSKATPL